MPPHNQLIRNEEPIEDIEDITSVINISTSHLFWRSEMSEKDEKCEIQRLYDMLLDYSMSLQLLDHWSHRWIISTYRTEILISTKRSKTENCNATQPFHDVGHFFPYRSMLNWILHLQVLANDSIQTEMDLVCLSVVFGVRASSSTWITFDWWFVLLFFFHLFLLRFGCSEYQWG